MLISVVPARGVRNTCGGWGIGASDPAAFTFRPGPMPSPIRKHWFAVFLGVLSSALPEELRGQRLWTAFL